MLRIAVGSFGHLTTVSRDGKLLPCMEATVFLHMAKPTKVWLKLAETDGITLTESEETVVADTEEILLVTSQ